MDPVMSDSAWVLVIGLLVCLLVRLPVAISLAAPVIVYILIEPRVDVDVALLELVNALSSYVLLAVPLFVLMGVLANRSGMADRLFDAAQSALGGLRGTQGYVNVGVSVGFSWMSGSALSDAASMGALEVPAMTKRGFSRRFAAGLTGASSLISPIMPPSIPAIIYAMLASVSVGSLFLAGILPALILSATLFVTVWVYTLRHPELESEPSTWRVKRTAFRRAIVPLAIPVIVLGGILGGVFTPTEAGAVAAGYLVVASLVLRELPLRQLWSSLTETARITSGVLVIFSAAGLYAWALTIERVPAVVAGLVTRWATNEVTFLLVAMAVLLIVGMFLDPGAALVIMVPILLPVAQEFGVDAVRFGTIMIMTLMVGLLTPPVGLILFVLDQVTDMSFGEIVRGMLPFYIPCGLALLITAFVPAVTMWLPGLVG